MAVRSQEILNVIQRQITGQDLTADVQNVGQVIEVGDGIARIWGLSECAAGELLEFPGGPDEPTVMALALNLEEETIGCVILGPYTQIQEGNEVRRTGRIAQVPVGDALIGRVVNALGEPVDGKGPIVTSTFRPVERIAPGVVRRQPVKTPVQTGIKAIDAMIPIGRGQRELIIGDRSTGKSVVALDTIINQKGQDLICIYVAIGQKESSIAETVGVLEEYGAMEHTIVVAAAAADPALNVGISVSRVGGSAQTRAMRTVAGRMKLELAQFRSLAAFAQFASDLDPATRAQLERGLRLQEILKQSQFQPVPLAKQVAIIWAGTNGQLDEVPVGEVGRFET